MKWFLKLLLIYLITLVCVSPIAANPFSNSKTSSNSSDTVKITTNPNNSIPFFQVFFTKSVKIQRGLTVKLSGFIREIAESPSLKLWIILLGISFIYGLIHALGPGHGKTIAFSYFLNKSEAIKKGLVFGNIFALSHAFSAIIIVTISYFFLKTSIRASFSDASHIIQLISFTLIMLIGAFLMAKKSITLFKQASQRSIDPITNHAQLDNANISLLKPGSNADKGLVVLAVTAGMIPCPGAMIILIFSLSMNYLLAGIFSVLAMSAGMALTISFFGVMSISGKRLVSSASGRGKAMLTICHHGVEYFGAVMIFLLGLFYLAGVLV
ncbi:nickel/cobalt transporter [Thermoproteota archaeon]